ncbi:MAG: hypothetical protein KatS3mg115_2529 [Candidatus Poribacteria bacterium]|nr:MAG: hypothetical protein KatS3mg115_2529 [Candidatus Poribacteria bacterium]
MAATRPGTPPVSSSGSRTGPDAGGSGTETWTARISVSSVPETPDREHQAAHIAPNGEYLVYLSYPKGRTTYSEQPWAAELHLIRTDGSNDRVIIPEARAYGQSRAVVWLSDTQFVYIGGDGRTYRYDLATGQSTVLVQEPPRDKPGWLLDPTLRFAVWGYPASVFVYDPERKQVSLRQELGGCEIYFAAGRWAVWMDDAGGPIGKVDLLTGQEGHILQKHDPRLPEGRGYMYFPMVSRQGDLLAFGASPDQHDHMSADYDIFVIRTDPTTLEPIGRAVRYTFHPATDRFPDVYTYTAALGMHAGEAPLTVELSLEGDDWVWDLGDGTTERGSRVRHTYTRPGE